MMTISPLLSPEKLAFVVVCEDGCASTSCNNCSMFWADLKRIAQMVEAPILDIRNRTVLTDYSEFLDEIIRTERNTLLIAGGLLEGVISRLSLSALVKGFDVFVAVDQVISEEEDHRSVFLKRISDYGGNVVSRNQFVRELAASTRDNQSREQILTLINVK